MKIAHVLGHNSNWSIDSYNNQNIGDNFLITAYSHGMKFLTKKSFQNILDLSMIDLQYYGKKHSKGKLSEFDFHPSNVSSDDVTNVYFENCLKQAIKFQQENNFSNIIIPHLYEDEEVYSIVQTIKNINKYVSKIKRNGEKYFMTLPFANHIIVDKAKVEEILFECTDMDICFDGFFVVCENKPETRRKLSINLKLMKNLARVLKTLKDQGFETIYGYANWDAVIYLAHTDIDYITIGTYENLRNFDIKRFTEDESGGGSKGYYFSEKLLNMVRADDITLLRGMDCLEYIRNERNIFSDIILEEGFPWNIHKPDVNKNYLLAISRLLNNISGFTDIEERRKYVSGLVKNAIDTYDQINDKGVYLDKISDNYHLSTWRAFLSLSI